MSPGCPFVGGIKQYFAGGGRHLRSGWTSPGHWILKKNVHSPQDLQVRCPSHMLRDGITDIIDYERGRGTSR